MRTLGRPEAGADITAANVKVFLLQTFGGQPAKTNSNAYSGNGGAGALQFEELESEKEEKEQQQKYQMAFRSSSALGPCVRSIGVR